MKANNQELSSNLAIRGPFVDETFRAFSTWDLKQSDSDNFAKIAETNSIGASSQSWLKKFLQVLSRRYEFGGTDRRLIELVQQGWPIDDWRPVQLWHMSRHDALLRVFLTEWLFGKLEEGVVVISAQPVVDFLQGLVKQRLGSIEAWKENTYRRVANGLLKIAVEFHLMRGRVNKEFEAYRLPERSFLYLLHVLMEREHNTRRVVEAKDWRLFLMKPNDVEEELLRLHQYGKLRFERAGSFLELTLPCENTVDYVRSAVG
ncbi:BrxA family protein [Aeoliella sp.]|uniref:BrxA family protein n=1 Tax=Aeoliella sp. TaxID=2795800 RepID=UPI003CCC31E4